jgi:diguanylate cyclase (GGDEF)-like protein/PAS domain S-box-containing protein
MVPFSKPECHLPLLLYMLTLLVLVLSAGYVAVNTYRQALDTAGGRLAARADLAAGFVTNALQSASYGSGAPAASRSPQVIVDSLAQVSLSEGQSIAVIDESMKIVVRLPAISGRKPAQGTVISEPYTRRFIESDADSHRAIISSPLDGEKRLYVFQRVRNTPYVVVVGEKTSVALQGWQQVLWVESAGIVLVAVIGFFFLRQFCRRVAVETELVNEISERKNLQRKAQTSEAHLQALIDSIPDLIFGFDEEGRFAFVHASDDTHLLRSPEELLGFHFREVLSEELARRFDRIRSEVENSGSNHQFDYQLVVDGEAREFEARVSVLRGTEGQHNGFLAVVRDVTESTLYETELQIASTAFETHLGLIITDNAGVILRANRAFTRITGYQEPEVVGNTPRLLQSGLHDAGFYNHLWSRIQEVGTWEGEIWNRRKNGEVFAEWMTITAVYNEAGAVQNYVGTFHDITRRKEAEREIHRLAFYDSLTGLANRALLEERIANVCAANDRQNTHAALLYMDIEQLRAVNDARGYETGDLVLKSLTDRLATLVRESDTLARIGGDEFALLLTGLNASREVAARAAETVANKIIEAFSRPVELENKTIQVEVSVGISLLDGRATQCGQQLQKAEQATQQAKERARSRGERRIAFFDAEIQQKVVQQVLLEAELRNALAGSELRVFFQPQVTNPDELSGYEVLLRWQHQEKGMVSPGVFIPIAENSRLILPIGLWVLEQACKRLAVWQSEPLRSGLSLAVNVSIVQFQSDDFVEQLASILEKTGAPSHLLKLEVTESLLMDDPERIAEMMNRLRSLGIRFALDDFGTGYSSMSYLNRLPLDQIKIDQSFIRDVATSAASAAIVDSTIGLAKGLGLEVIAEGVETEAQREWLVDHGCRHFQGYLFGRPAEIV